MNQATQAFCFALPHPDPSVIAAGPLVKQPQIDEAYRVVLGRTTSGLVVSKEFFPDWPNTDRSYFGSGEYFVFEDVVKATERFSLRVAEHASFITSCFQK